MTFILAYNGFIKKNRYPEHRWESPDRSLHYGIGGVVGREGESTTRHHVFDITLFFYALKSGSRKTHTTRFRSLSNRSIIRCLVIFEYGYNSPIVLSNYTPKHPCDLANGVQLKPNLCLKGHVYDVHQSLKYPPYHKKDTLFFNICKLLTTLYSRLNIFPHSTYTLSLRWFSKHPSLWK